MTLIYRRPSVLAALLLAACSDDGSMTNAGPGTAAHETTGGAPTSDPSTTAPTSDPTTGGSTGPGSTGTTADASTTGAQSAACSQITDKNACALSPDCKWGSVVSYTHGTNGCQGSIKELCLPKTTDPAITAYWRDDGDGTPEVLQFGFNPTDLDPEWKPCDCDGPLACLCTNAALDCPDRLSEFCGEITGKNGCNNAATGGALVCNWFRVRPTGAADTHCGDKAQFDICLNSTPDPDPCDQDTLVLPYEVCNGPKPPVFWREVDGEIEITQSCDHTPIGWSQCTEDDPNQPEDCKCLCL